MKIERATILERKGDRLLFHSPFRLLRLAMTKSPRQILLVVRKVFYIMIRF
jgi:hypothetical protein